VCDDDKYICSEIERIILDYGSKVINDINIEVFHSGEELCKFLSEGEMFDLVFLDIELKQISGVEVGRRIREELKNETIQIVYISALDNYYRALFDVRPMHFLHKPLEPEKIIKDIEKAIELVELLGNTFSYHQGHNFYRKSIKGIFYFEANKRQVKMIGVDGESYFYDRLCDISQKLSKYHFFLIHKSYLINYAHVIKFNRKEVVMSNNIILPISRNKSDEVMRLLLQYEKEGV
jgi:DNA-binding LytR/AlgR family response regulator